MTSQTHSRVDKFLRPACQPATIPSRQPHLRPRRHRLARTDLGCRLSASGPDVPRGRRHRLPLAAARLLPGSSRLRRRVQGVSLGRRPDGDRQPDGQDHLPGRPYPDRQGPQPCPLRRPPGGRSTPWSSSATPARKGPISSIQSSRSARRSQRARLHVPGGTGSGRAEALSGDRPRRPMAPITASTRAASRQLAELLRAVAIFTVGGVAALRQGSDAAKRLLAQMPPPG